jgi:hypothetical protein
MEMGWAEKADDIKCLEAVPLSYLYTLLPPFPTLYTRASVPYGEGN